MVLAFRCRAHFRQHIPSKPAKYGITIYAICDAKTFYVCNMEIFAGLQPEGPYKADKEYNQMLWSQDLQLTSLGLLEMSHLITDIPASH